MNIQRPRGTIDLYGKLMIENQTIIDILIMIAKLNGYSQIKTPIFENKELFTRTVGETSDIVTKEIYDFKDKSNRDLALRPEGTASVIRAIVENKIIDNEILPIKLFYYGPMFRYERPQTGRQREFNQFGIECIGISNAYDIVDILTFVISIVDSLKIKNYKLKINSIGTWESRQKWINALKKYFKDFKNELTEDSINRLEKNPLRILDDKIDGKKDFVKNAPKLESFMGNDEKNNFDEIVNILKKLNIDFVVDNTLVRGLDYYSNFVFEVTYSDQKNNSDLTIIGGGQYNNLLAELGGKNLNCFGFAIGIERLIIAAETFLKEYKSKEFDVVIAPLVKDANLIACAIARILRSNGFSTTIKFDNAKLEKQFKYANKYQPRYIFIIGENELKNKEITIKNQQNKQQNKIKIEEIEKFLKDMR